MPELVWLLPLLEIILGFFLLHLGAEFFVQGNLALSTTLKWSHLWTGTFTASLGTSSPELFVSLAASLEDLEILLLSNLVGSNLFNLLGILGVILLFYPLSVGISPHLRINIWFLHLVTYCIVFFWIIAQLTSPFSLHWPMGCFLLSIFFFYIFLCFRLNRLPSQSPRQAPLSFSDKKSSQKYSFNLFIAIVKILIGITVLIGGSRWAVIGIETLLLKNFHWNPHLVGLTLVAIATSAPELVTSLKAAKQGYFSLLLGILLGSSIANFSLILGAAVLLNPLTLPYPLGIDLIFLVFVNTIVVYAITRLRHRQFTASVLLFLYTAYMVYSFKGAL